MHGLTILDIVLWVVLLGCAAKGFLKGLVREVCALLGVVAGAWGAFTYYGALGALIRSFIHLPHPITATISFLLIYAVIGILFFFVGHLFTVIFKVMLLGWLNRLGGVAFGFLQGAFIASILLALGMSNPVPAKIKGYLQSSPSGRYFIQVGRDMITGWEGVRHKENQTDRR